MPLLDAERPLFERVLAAPDDPVPRRILADALVERGEPYGELLHLASGGASQAARSRGRDLRERAAVAFLGPIAETTGRERAWRHGLLHGVLLKPNAPDALAACADDPLWGTVHTARISGAMDARIDALFTWTTERAPWRWLARVEIAGPGHYQRLRRTPDFGVRALRGAFMTPDHLADLGDTRVFPLLTEVIADVVPLTPAHAEARLAALHRRKLQVVGFGLHPATFATLVRAAAHSAADTVRFEDDTWRLEVRPRDWSWTATPRSRDAARSTVHGLMRRLDRAFVGSLEVLELQ